jgi:DNA-binding CsgD family transcriptional regulator
MLITVINSVCLGFAVYYLFVCAPLDPGFSVLVFGGVLLILCAIRVADIVKFKRTKPLFSALTIMPYVAICILPLSYLDTRFWMVSCCLMLGISTFNVMVNRSAIFGYAEKSKKTSPLFFLYDCTGNIAGIGIGLCCSFLVFGEQFTGQIANIYVPSILVIVIMIIWAAINRKSLEKQLNLLEPSESRNPTQKDDPFHSWREKMEEFSNYYHLSPRQHEVLLLLAKGRNAGYIKEKLVISNHTAKAHIYNIYQKTNVSSRQGLISLIEEFDKKDQ